MSMALYSVALLQLGNHAKSFAIADLAADLLKRFSEKPGDNYAKTLIILHTSVISAKKPLQDSLKSYMECCRVGIRTGDVEHALIGAMCYGYNYFFCGLLLSPLESDMKSFGKESRQFGLAPSVQVQFPMFEPAVLNLKGESDNATLLKGKAMDQETLLRNQVEGHGESIAFRDICIFRLALSYIFRDFDTAKQMLEALSKFSSFSLALLVSRCHIRQAFAGLSAFALHRTTRQMKYIVIAKGAKKGSLNAYPIYTFLQTEKSPSKENYDKAIRACSRSGL